MVSFPSSKTKSPEFAGGGGRLTFKPLGITKTIVLAVVGVGPAESPSERFTNVAPDGMVFKVPDAAMKLAVLGEKVKVEAFVVLELEEALARAR